MGLTLYGLLVYYKIFTFCRLWQWRQEIRNVICWQTINTIHNRLGSQLTSVKTLPFSGEVWCSLCTIVTINSEANISRNISQIQIYTQKKFTKEIFHWQTHINFVYFLSFNKNVMFNAFSHFCKSLAFNRFSYLVLWYLNC